MALGNSQIQNMEKSIENIEGVCKKVCDSADSPWNTFKYVIDNLNNWADETQIGQDSRNELKSLTDRVEGLNNNTKILCGEFKRYLDEQRKYNSNIQ